jgi:ribosomal protein S18 acetylase RimI-like enzyme
VPVPSLCGWAIESIYVPPAQRRKGLAHDLLREVTRDADNDGITLFLSIQPDSSGGMNEVQLLLWFRRHGFAPVAAQTSRVIMIRGAGGTERK